MHNIAVILAGGIGKRMGSALPKQLLPLSDGRTILEHAVDAFRSCALIDDVLVVMHPDFVDEIKKKMSCTIIPGGAERWQSSYNAIRFLLQQSSFSHQPSSVNILLHDAARPFVSERIIRDVCLALENHEAVTVAVPATDTMYSVVCNEDGARLVDIPVRASMMRAQTPQAFRLNLIHRAYELALQDPALQVTDDCGIVHRYMPSTPVYIVEGEESNRKITFKEDIVL